MNDSEDGLEINRLIAGRFIGRQRGSMSMLNADNVVIELIDRGSRFYKVSILGEVRRVNSSKTRRINGYKDKIGR
jgi:hypothetical protein